jgi:hypothetical protein
MRSDAVFRAWLARILLPLDPDDGELRNNPRCLITAVTGQVKRRSALPVCLNSRSLVCCESD